MRNYHYYDGKYRDFVIRSLKHKGYKCIGNYIDTTIIISSHDRTYNFYGKSFSDLMMDIDKYPLRKYLN